MRRDTDQTAPSTTQALRPRARRHPCTGFAARQSHPTSTWSTPLASKLVVARAVRPCPRNLGGLRTRTPDRAALPHAAAAFDRGAVALPGDRARFALHGFEPAENVGKQSTTPDRCRAARTENRSMMLWLAIALVGCSSSAVVDPSVSHSGWHPSAIKAVENPRVRTSCRHTPLLGQSSRWDGPIPPPAVLVCCGRSPSLRTNGVSPVVPPSVTAAGWFVRRRIPPRCGDLGAVASAGPHPALLVGCTRSAPTLDRP